MVPQKTGLLRTAAASISGQGCLVTGPCDGSAWCTYNEYSPSFPARNLRHTSAKLSVDLVMNMNAILGHAGIPGGGGRAGAVGGGTG